MVTRREVLGASITATTVLGCAGIPVLGNALRRQFPTPRDVQALLVSGSIALPEGLRFISAPGGGQIPMIRVGLAHGAYRELKRVLDRYEVVAGLSSGASLFCIERIAWDHGLRLAQLQQHEVPAGDRSFNARVAMDLIHAVPDPGAMHAGLPAYRPSRTDGIVHAWILEQAGPTRSHRQSQQEFA